ncbi:MAG TPA: YkvA family protein, partial [Clostridia bacterium]|nr:YkvA family protein [Clostridia bacterium]
IIREKEQKRAEAQIEGNGWDGFMLKRIKLTIQYLKDRNVSVFKKLLIIGSLLYLVFPVDIVPDFLIGLGILDDITVLTFVWIALKAELDDYGSKKEAAEIKKSRVIPFEIRDKNE